MSYAAWWNRMDTGQAKPPPAEDAPTQPDVNPSAPGWSPLGKHRYYVDGEMLVFEVNGGEFTLAECELFIQAIETVQNRYGYHLLLADASRGVTLAATVRRRFIDWTAKYHIKPTVAVVGAGLTTRTMAALIMNAMRLFGRPAHTIEFFPTLAEGRNWLLERRAELAQRQSR